MKILSQIALISLALCLTSCGTSYRNHWNSAQTKPVAAGSIEGAWVGTWHSDKTGHTGKLWCIIGPGAANERTFEYRATWGKIFSGSFSALHKLTPKGNATAFSVEHSIDKKGAFHAEGTVSADSFTACYKAVGDVGTFQLRRP